MESSSLSLRSSSSPDCSDRAGARVSRSWTACEAQPRAGFWRSASRRPALWLVPAAVVWSVTAAYVVIRPTEWEAVQAVSVRPQEASAPGDARWLDGDQRKSLQETLLELFRSRAVLEAALREVDRLAETPTADGTKEVVDPRRIDRLRRVIKVTPPQGADLGSSDILCLHVRDADKTRAVKLAETLCRQADLKWRSLRREKAVAAAAEWEQAVRSAELELRRVNERLAAMEKDLGPRLPELRAWATGPGGDTPLVKRLSELITELRATEVELADTEGLLRDVRAAVTDSSRLLDAANALIKREPSIEQWKTAWVEAQVRLADARGRMTDRHPEVVAAAAAEREIHDRLVEELSAFVSILEGERDDLREKCGVLQARITATNEEIRELASKRVEYANLSSEREQRLAVLQNARQREDDARLAADAVTSTQLLIPIEDAETGLDPVGPGRATILAAGLVAGILFGFGVLAWCLPTCDAPHAVIGEESSIARGSPGMPRVTERRFTETPVDEPGPVADDAAPSSKKAPSESPVRVESPTGIATAAGRREMLSIWTASEGPLPDAKSEAVTGFSAALIRAAAEQSAIP